MPTVFGDVHRMPPMRCAIAVTRASASAVPR